jgi:hypothetical protein
MSDDEEAGVWGDPTPSEIEELKQRLREAHYAARRGEGVPEEFRGVVRVHEYYGNGRKPARKRQIRGTM